MFVISTATFFLLNLTGQDPVRQVLGPVASAEQVEAKRQQLGLDEPLITQYFQWLGSAVRGDLGRSWFTNQPVGELLSQTLPPTLSMVIGSLILAACCGTLIGVTAALRRGGRLDRGLQVASTLVQAIPGFLVALVLALVFAVQLRMLPATGSQLSAILPASGLLHHTPGHCIGSRLFGFHCPAGPGVNDRCHAAGLCPDTAQPGGPP